MGYRMRWPCYRISVWTSNFSFSLGPEAATPILPQDQTVIAGDNVTFYCILASKSPSTSAISWLKDGRPLDYSGLDVGGGFGPISGVLTLQNVGASNSGDYSCVGYDGDTHNATLKVIGMYICEPLLLVASRAVGRHWQSIKNYHDFVLCRLQD